MFITVWMKPLFTKKEIRLKSNCSMTDKEAVISKIKGEKHKANSAQVRLTKDLEEAINNGDKISIPDQNNIQRFHVTVQPTVGFWRGGKFIFEFNIPDNWPIDPPNVKCLTKVWHPNIDEDGPVCLNLLRDNYLPVITISTFVEAIYFLFNEPNPNSPLNVEAANMFQKNKTQFQEKVTEYINEYCPK